MSLRGEIYSYSVVDGDQVPPGFEEFAPLVMAMVLVEIPDHEERKREKIMMTMSVVDLDPKHRFSDQVRIGQGVELVVRKHGNADGVGVITYGQSARIVEEDRVDMNEMREDGRFYYTRE